MAFRPISRVFALSWSTLIVLLVLPSTVGMVFTVSRRPVARGRMMEPARERISGVALWTPLKLVAMVRIRLADESTVQKSVRPLSALRGLLAR